MSIVHHLSFAMDIFSSLLQAYSELEDLFHYYEIHIYREP